ncbi:hypothetical protein [Mucilaginibacter sp.]|uniref:hypothetical protein n=1 Tax=Mucilaginibacter sp. TaxID=1882438 RepID=UPI00262DC309|nr:hypothetical protein [Mucilaginibacter sp.]MDB4925936.1 hypothetical protein [Mucilaginibacter sp.]
MNDVPIFSTSMQVLSIFDATKVAPEEFVSMYSYIPTIKPTGQFTAWDQVTAFHSRRSETCLRKSQSRKWIESKEVIKTPEVLKCGEAAEGRNC